MRRQRKFWATASVQLLISGGTHHSPVAVLSVSLLAFGASEKPIGYATDYMNIYAIGNGFCTAHPGHEYEFITAQGFAATTGMLRRC